MKGTSELRKFLALLLFAVSLCCCAAVAAVSIGPQDRMDDQPSIQPSDFFVAFPDLRFGMSFPEAKKLIEKTGASPVAFGSSQSELTWDAAFNKMNGRATVFFKDAEGLSEIAVLVYAMDKRRELFEEWSKKILEKQGAPTESDTSQATSRLWKLKTGFTIELRLIKDENSPVVDIHWVKE